MIKLDNDNLVKFNNSITELGGIFLGCKKNEHDESVFIDFYNRDSNERNLNILVIGKSGPGKVFCLKHRL